MSGFDPDSARQCLLALNLPMLDFQPWSQSPTRIARHVHDCVGRLAECYWVGLGDIARPKLRAILGWMDGQSPPHPAVWPSHSDHWTSASTHHFWWWQSAALARWLAHDDPAEADFARAVGIERDALANAPADALEFEREELEMMLAKVLPMALSGQCPAIGAELDRMCTERSPHWGARPALEFGRWACTHLATGGTRDAEYVARGEAMLSETLLSYFQYMPGMGEATLWLKAIYFDSGVTRTAEETILRAYDLMPGVAAPTPSEGEA